MMLTKYEHCHHDLMRLYEENERLGIAWEVRGGIISYFSPYIQRNLESI